MVSPMVWSVADRDGIRRRGAGDAAPGRRPHPGQGGRPAAQARRRRPARRRVRRPAAPAGARAGRRDDPGADDVECALHASPRPATSGARTARLCTPPTRSCGSSSTGSSCTGCAVPTWCPTTTPRCAGSAAASASPRNPDQRLVRTWQHHRREVSRLHQKLFYRPLLSAVARIPGDDVRLSSEAAAGPPGRARVRRPRRRAAQPRGADRRCHPHGQHPAGAAAGDARSGSRTGPIRTPACSGSGGSARRSVAPRGSSRTLRDEGEIAERLAHLLATSRYCSDLLEREPQGIKLLGGELTPQASDVLTEEMLATGGPAATTSTRRSARSGPYAAASCSGSPPATSSAWSTSRTSATHCPGSPTPPSRPRSRW